MLGKIAFQKAEEILIETGILLAFHTTGIEGNTLTLPQTSMIVNGIQLFAGFRDDIVTPQLSTSIKEVRNIQVAIDMLSLPSPQQIHYLKFSRFHFSKL